MYAPIQSTPLRCPAELSACLGLVSRERNPADSLKEPGVLLLVYRFAPRRANMRPPRTFVKRVNTRYCAFYLGQTQDVDACGNLWIAALTQIEASGRPPCGCLPVHRQGVQKVFVSSQVARRTRLSTFSASAMPCSFSKNRANRGSEPGVLGTTVQNPWVAECRLVTAIFRGAERRAPRPYRRASAQTRGFFDRVQRRPGE